MYMMYIHDENGAVNGIGLWYPGNTEWAYYYFVKNLQGDVLEIYSENHNCVATYTYDSWGNALSKSGSLADINPFRYRGYYFDNESWFYYLQSRYYDPAIGRFVNADILTSTGQGLLGNNMFAYCGNNPIILADPSGEWFIVVIGAATGALTSGIATAIQGGSQDEIFVSAICGAFSGVFAATGAGGLLGQAVVGALSSLVDSGFQNYSKYSNGRISKQEAIAGTLVDTALGATFAAIGFEGTDALRSSDIVSNNTMEALHTLAKNGLHPITKKAAQKTARVGSRYLLSETKQAFLDNILTTTVSIGIGKTAELLY